MKPKSIRVHEITTLHPADNNFPHLKGCTPRSIAPCVDSDDTTDIQAGGSANGQNKRRPMPTHFFQSTQTSPAEYMTALGHRHCASATLPRPPRLETQDALSFWQLERIRREIGVGVVVMRGFMQYYVLLRSERRCQRWRQWQDRPSRCDMPSRRRARWHVWRSIATWEKLVEDR
jgi:hypothetical protein